MNASMKVLWLCLICSLRFIDASQQNEFVQQQSVYSLIRRVLPTERERFFINVDFNIKTNNDIDIFYLRSFEDNINITASSGYASAYGLHHFLKYFCSAHISWDYNQLDLSKCQWTDIYEVIQFNDRYRYYQNACTPSYSFVWWDWRKWEAHIDWMAMQGFNLVPAMNGQEALWMRVYLKLGMTRKEVDEHFAGPAFLAWSRMGNMRGFGGPLSSSWHQKQLNLNRQIIKRLRSFGISTVLPAFSGLVPSALQRLYPNVTMYQLPRWNKFNDTYCCTYLMDPTHVLFKLIGSLFMFESTNEFGTDHYYSCDTFNEMVPFTTDLDELQNIGRALFSSMTITDPKAIWLLQGWMFHYDSDYWLPSRVDAFVNSVSLGKMIILDLQSEQYPQYQRFENYFGQPYIWCMLHNFGGTLSMFGSAEIINNRVFEARNMQNSTLIGTGIAPEGIDQNYVMYDLMSEMSYRKEPANLTLWFSDYATRRYGKVSENVTTAWDILRKTVYSYDLLLLQRGKFVYNRSPRTNIKPWTWYNKTQLYDAFALLSADLSLWQNLNYLHDFIDISRQLLQNNIDDMYTILMREFNWKRIDIFHEVKAAFLQQINLIEMVLKLDDKWQLANWLNSAKAMADSEEERALFEYNARNQISLWGPNGEIKDYANKQWAGVVSDLFLPRWQLFLKHMSDSLRHNVRFNEKGARRDVFEKVEEPFTFSQKLYSYYSYTSDEKLLKLQDYSKEIKRAFQYLQALKKKL